MDVSRIDAEKYTATATAIRAEQNRIALIDRTTADDMAEDLRQRQERVKSCADRVAGLELELTEQEGKWTNYKNAIESAERLLATRPDLRHDIAAMKDKLEKCEEEGAEIKKHLDRQRDILKQAKSDVKPLSDKNPRGFDFAKFDRLQAEEKALRVVEQVRHR
ncbi:MAG TPA: hypothetical protein VNX88_18645 [Terriglobales bacterium]|jgi:hypothetical protein|nr:hypothetical protein [Terriglobales bacterium]